MIAVSVTVPKGLRDRDRDITITTSKDQKPMFHPSVKFRALLVIAAISATGALAQKVKVGHEKNVNFAHYRSYSVQKPAAAPTRPLLYDSVMGTVKQELEAKGYKNVESGGDLTLIPAGGIGYDLPSIPDVLSDSCSNCQRPALDAQWAGYMAPPGTSGKSLPRGTLQLTFVDTATKKMVWNGVVTQELDPAKSEKSIGKITTAIQKLLAEFPSRK
ncbi:MAG: DUF4136 domain-containing protein [Terracidiphilus sp.]